MSGNVKRGIVIIAAGNQMYGQMAMNAAMGIKTGDMTAHITLLKRGPGVLNGLEPYMSIFDNVVDIPDECVTRNGLESLLRAKVCLYDLSPYEETIYIDADVITFPMKKITALFDELDGIDFTMGNRGKTDLSTDPRLIWSKPDEMRKVFGDVTIYNLSSEFMYFKKTDRVREFFEIAKTAFDEPGVIYNRFAGTVPDELAFQIAMIKSDVAPHRLPFLPFYWEPYEKKNRVLSDLYKLPYYGYSIGGARLNPQQKNAYDTLAKVYARGFGLKFPLLSKSKNGVLPSRKDI